MRYTSSSSLSLEQVPNYRGTMRSMSAAASNLGSAIGTGFSGLILLSFGYGGLGPLGILSIIASILFKFYAVDPS